MAAGVREGAGQLYRRCDRRLMFVAKIGDQSEIEHILSGVRMGADARKGGTVLPLLHTTAYGLRIRGTASGISSDFRARGKYALIITYQMCLPCVGE